ncbi:MAG: DEAD/DEAH box helicase, partial [Ilumatobacteraceae bacterium]
MSENTGPASTFAELDLRPELLAALTALGYEEPTPIQRDAIPHVLAGRDVLGQAATGTGKTAAFALPALQLIDREERRAHPIALVLVPTRELAVQVSEATYKYGRELGARVLPIYGGQPIGRQLGALRDGVHIVVATPGRAIDHINRGTLQLDGIKLVVLDEADEMLDMGFAEDIESILGSTPAERQTVLFSATLPPRINSIAKRHLTDPVRIQIERPSSETGSVPLVTQRAFVVSRAHKPAALGRILDVEAPTAAIVFCRTRTEVDQLTETLNGRGYRAEALHGGMTQEGRDRVMGRLRNGTAELLV